MTVAAALVFSACGSAPASSTDATASSRSVENGATLIVEEAPPAAAPSAEAPSAEAPSADQVDDREPVDVWSSSPLVPTNPLAIPASAEPPAVDAEQFTGTASDAAPDVTLAPNIAHDPLAPDAPTSHDHDAGDHAHDGASHDHDLGPHDHDHDATGAETSAPRLVHQVDLARVAAHVEQWLGEHDVAGARIGLSFPDGSSTVVVAGTEADGSRLDRSGNFLATSVTKTMTSAIVFDLIGQGKLNLDDPAPVLDAFPEFAHAEKVTIRQLLQHTSGLAPYQRSENWAQSMSLDPIGVLDLADDLPLEWTPGTERGYSGSGYVYLGLIVEQITGQSFESVLDARLAELGLDQTFLDPTVRPGWVGYAAGGLVSTVPDLLTWGAALYRDGQVLEQAMLSAMLDANNPHSTGLGANLICPCRQDEAGRLQYTSIGHDGGSVTLQYSPADNMVVAAKFTESFWTDELSQVEVHQLLAELRELVT